MLNTRSATELYPPPRKWCIFEVSYSIAGNFLGSLTRERSSVLSSLFSWKEELSSGPSTRPSLAEPLLCKSYQVTRKSILPVLFPRPVFDFFHVRYIKGPDQPYICLKSEERKLCIWSVKVGEIKNYCIKYLKPLKVLRKLLYVFCRRPHLGQRKKS